MSEELEEQAELQVYEAAEVTLGDPDDLIVKISLPTYADVTDDKIIREMRSVFHGFTFDASVDLSKQFTDPDQLADYMRSIIADIGEHQRIGHVAKIQNNSAALAYFWVMGYEADQTIANSSYGNGACKRIAERMGKSVPYIYQLRSVGTRLTLQDCWLLGMREGCNTTTLRKLAQIRDQELCKQIIRTFIEATQDTSDVIQVERATRAFKQAIRDALKPDSTLEEATTNPEEVTESLEDIAGPAYAAGLTAVKKIQRETKYFSNEENVIAACDALSDFAIVASVPNADQLLSDFKVEVDTALEQCKAMIEYLGDMVDQLESVKRVEVLSESPRRKRSS